MNAWTVVILLLLLASTAAAQDCVGDLDCDRLVTVDEITRSVNSALSGGVIAACGSCPEGGIITVSCILTIIRNALEGCPELACLGDCDGDGRVTEAEIRGCLQSTIPVEVPPCCDANGDGQATTDEILAMESNRIAGCRR